MTNIDEAIKHYEEKAKELYCKADEDFFFDGDWGKKLHCTESAKEHEQLANWLRELKMLSWIPVKTRMLDADALKKLKDRYGDFDDDEAWCICSPLPKDAQEVLITTKYGDVVLTEFCVDDDGCCFDGYEDRGDVLAWMPLPEPYKEDSDT